MPTLESILDAFRADRGLKSNNSAKEIERGAAGARDMNEVAMAMIAATGVNADGVLTVGDMYKLATATYASAADYVKFTEGHGRDNGTFNSGFHHVRGDGGTLMFQGQQFVDTIADSIYSFGYRIKNGTYYNQDGNTNKEVGDVAGWMNYFVNGENIVYGSGQNDSLYSGKYSAYFRAARNETFMAGDGKDNIGGDVGNDKIYGGSGNDLAGGGRGNDRMFGEGGNDRLYGDQGRDKMFGGFGDDVMGGGEDGDELDGGAGADTIYGDDGGDILRGGDARDDLNGGRGNDRLFGDAGNDKLYGSEGADVLKGGTGVDQIHLWENNKARDVVSFDFGDSGNSRGSIDKVEGFKSGQDKIDLTSFDTMIFKSLNHAGNGTASCYFDGDFLRIDQDGNGTTDMMIEFIYIDRLRASDFLFG